MKFLSYPLLFLLMSTIPAFGTAISNPYNGEHVSSPFTLVASSPTCSYLPVTTIGYSLDYGDTTMFHGKTNIDTTVSTSAGTHTVHVKAWNDKGQVCVADVGIDVTSVTDNPGANPSVVSPTAPSPSVVPSTAVSVSSIQRLSSWKGVHDSGTSGWSSGAMSLVGSPTYSGSSRRFVTSYSSTGGERYYVTFGDNATATNFFYDAWIYVTSSVTHIANIEMDMNQTMPNGQTVIFGVQCDGYSSTWDYTENLGSPWHPRGHWAHSGSGCNPRNWTRYKWHHIQIEYSRDNYGKVTYKYVWFDGVQNSIWRTVPSAYASGWGKTLLTNFQVDGLGGGSSTVYLDDLTVKRW